jgi:hypothetical protein
MFRILALVVFLTAIASSTSAQGLPDQQPPPDQPPPAAVVVPGQRGTPKPPAAPVPTPMPGVQTPDPMPVPVKPPAAAARIRGKDVNVQVEIAISDQMGTATPQKKVVSLLAADQTMGRVRANARAQATVGFVGTGLNVDARPILLENDRILLELTLEYMPLTDAKLTHEPTNLNESITVILQNGKPLTISQAADPISDRKMTVEVKATVVK